MPNLDISTNADVINATLTRLRQSKSSEAEGNGEQSAPGGGSSSANPPTQCGSARRRGKSVFASSSTTMAAVATAGRRQCRPSFLQGRYSLIVHPESVMASFGRNTLMARDTIFGHLARASFLRPNRSLADTAGKLVHEVNHMVATYKSLVQLIGTHQDSAHLRDDLMHLKEQCLKTCDSAKNCILPQLKSETREPCHSSEFTKHANQFIGSVNLFIIEMRRCHSLFQAFPSCSAEAPARTEGSENGAGRPRPSCDSCPKGADERQRRLNRDIAEAEDILETLENAITVHFSTGKADPEKCPVIAKSTRRNWRLGKLFANFKTSYA